MSAKITQQMRAYVSGRRHQQKDSALEQFLDDFSHNFEDDEEAERVFSNIWESLDIHRAVNTEKTNATYPKKTEISGDYLVAPYRFVALNETIVKPEQQVFQAWEKGELHDVPLTGGLSGVLDIAITFDGPMLIGKTEGDVERPLTLGGKHVIPGATLRGLTRATLEIAAFARLYQTNLHRRYSIRDFDHALFRDEDRARVRAGWLTRDAAAPSGYAIAPCKWWRVKIRDLPGCATGAGHLEWLRKSLEERYQALSMKSGALFDFDKTHRFDAPSGTATGEGEATPNAEGAVTGVYVFSDRSPTSPDLTAATLDQQQDNKNKNNQKKTEAIFANAPGGPLNPIDNYVWRNFELNNSKPSRHRPVPAGNWGKLKPTLEAGRRIPVFWVADAAGGVADLGLVRVFKRALPHSTEDVLRRIGHGAHLVDPDAVSPDLVDALFGFVHEPETAGASAADMHATRHLKGRVAFGFARLSDKTPGRAGQRIATVLSAPKPSFAPFYLASADVKDWSSETATLAGRKRYPARDADAAAVKGWLDHVRLQGNDNMATQSRLCFLEPEGDKKLRFEGAIRVHNVTPVELGGLIWALTFGGKADKRHLIGRAKNAGAGQARITVARMALEANDGGAAPDAAALLEAFEKYMAEQAPGWATSAPVRELLRSAHPGYGKALGERLKYLSLKNHRALRKQVYDRNDSPPVNAKRPRLMGFD